MAIDPSTIVKIVNIKIEQNVAPLSESKTKTLTALKHLGHGVIMFRSRHIYSTTYFLEGGADYVRYSFLAGPAPWPRTPMSLPALLLRNPSSSSNSGKNKWREIRRDKRARSQLRSRNNQSKRSRSRRKTIGGCRSSPQSRRTMSEGRSSSSGKMRGQKFIW